MSSKAKIVVPYGDQKQAQRFADAWKVTWSHPLMHFQYDLHKEGCAQTKNKGMAHALADGAELIVILDDDCFPHNEIDSPELLIEAHIESLKPQRVKRFKEVTFPVSRGTPYMADNHYMQMPVACSMGFWHEVGDYCAARQLAYQGVDMEFKHDPIYEQYFPLCGMNIAFYPEEWNPWCQQIEVPRYDDIWMGWLWQREAYRRGYCFSLNGPTIRHSRQSNVWKNLKIEAKYAEQNDTLWREIASTEYTSYEDLRQLLPDRKQSETTSS